jgi:chemotaxis protein CheY-P-specific phosphatase CheC
MTLIDERPEPYEQDMVKEVASILSNNCATAFSKLVDDRISVENDFNFFFIDEFNKDFIFNDEFSNILEGLSFNVLEGYFIQVSGNINGICAIIFLQDDITNIIDSTLPLIDKKGAIVSDSLKSEIISEFSNISMQAYINALSKLLREPILSSLPIHAKDMLSSLYHFKKVVEKDNGFNAVSIKTSFFGKRNGLRGKLVVFLTASSYKHIISMLQ